MRIARPAAWLDDTIKRRLAAFDLADHACDVSDRVEIRGRVYDIRPYQPEDMRQILPLVDRLYREEMEANTGRRIDPGMLDRLADNAERISGAFIIACGGAVVGFLRYACWTHVLGRSKILENVYVYVVPEHRSFALFRRMIRVFERAGASIGVDRILFGFETGRTTELQRAALEKMGFRRCSVYLAKPVGRGEPSPAIPDGANGPRTFPSLAAARYLHRSTVLATGEFLLYLLGAYLTLRAARRGGQRFFELSGPDGAYLLARTSMRVFDRLRLAVVVGIRHPTSAMLRALEVWADAQGCGMILVNSKETMDDASALFPDHADHGYTVLGHIMGKAVSELPQPDDAPRGLP